MLEALDAAATVGLAFVAAASKLCLRYKSELRPRFWRTCGRPQKISRSFQKCGAVQILVKI